MGFLTNLLPGLRDFRTPLMVGCTWMIGLWLCFSGFGFMRSGTANLINTVEPIKPYMTTTIGLGLVSVVAYLLGSLLSIDVARPERTRIESWLAFPFRWLRGRASADLSPGNDWSNAGTTLYRRLREQDVARLEKLVLDAAVKAATEAAGDAKMKKIQVAVSSESIGGERGVMDTRKIAATVQFETSPSGLQRVWTMYQLDPLATSTRLHAANKGLWDQYDRVNAEAELRVSLAPAVLLIAIGMTLHASWWMGLIGVIVSYVVYRRGDSKSVMANGFLVNCLVAEVVVDPSLTSLNATPVTDSKAIEEWRSTDPPAPSSVA